LEVACGHRTDVGEHNPVPRTAVESRIAGVDESNINNLQVDRCGEHRNDNRLLDDSRRAVAAVDNDRGPPGERTMVIAMSIVWMMRVRDGGIVRVVVARNRIGCVALASRPLTAEDVA